MSEITKITMYHKSNFVTFDDTDMMTDYFHNYSLGQKETTEWLIQDGADLITVHVVNNDQSIPAVRRLKQICKKCGYEYTDKSHMHHYEIQNVDEYVLEYELRRINPSKFIVSWWLPEVKKFSNSVEMDKENATKFSKELRAKRMISVSMKRVIPSQ